VNHFDGALAYVVGPGIITLGTVMAARFAQRGSVKAAEVTASTEEKAGVADGYHQLVTDLQTDVKRLRQDHDELHKEHQDLKTHVRRLEDQAIADKSLIRWLIIYIRTLRDEILRLGGRVPEAPGDLDSKINRGEY
jgi:hypothetical protein